jgi:hypothetical protein
MKVSAATLDIPVLSFSDDTDTRPAFLVNGSDVLHAVEVSWDVFALLFGSLVTNWVS